MQDIADVEHLQAAVRPGGLLVEQLVRIRRREYFVGNEDVILVAPRGMCTAYESGSVDRLDLPVQRVQIILELRHKLRIGR